MKTIDIQIDSQGIATVTIDVKDRSMNVMTAEFLADWAETVDTITNNDEIKGAVVASGKETFFAGGDLIGFADPRDIAFACDYDKMRTALEVPLEALKSRRASRSLWTRRSLGPPRRQPNRPPPSCSLDQWPGLVRRMQVHRAARCFPARARLVLARRGARLAGVPLRDLSPGC